MDLQVISIYTPFISIYFIYSSQKRLELMVQCVFDNCLSGRQSCMFNELSAKENQNGKRKESIFISIYVKISKSQEFMYNIAIHVRDKNKIKVKN